MQIANAYCSAVYSIFFGKFFFFAVDGVLRGTTNYNTYCVIKLYFTFIHLRRFLSKSLR